MKPIFPTSAQDLEKYMASVDTPRPAVTAKSIRRKIRRLMASDLDLPDRLFLDELDYVVRAAECTGRALFLKLIDEYLGGRPF